MPISGDPDREASPFLAIFDHAPETARQLAYDFLFVTEFFNRHCDTPALTAFEYQSLLVALCYRLLEADPFQWQWPATSDQLTAAHAGMMSILMHMRYQSTHQQYAIVLTLQSSRLEQALERCTHSNGLTLWLLLVRAISLKQTSRDDILLGRIKKVCSDLDLTEWTSIRSMLQDYPWIDAMQNKPAEAIWIQATR